MHETKPTPKKFSHLRVALVTLVTGILGSLLFNWVLQDVWMEMKTSPDSLGRASKRAALLLNIAPPFFWVGILTASSTSETLSELTLHFFPFRPVEDNSHEVSQTKSAQCWESKVRRTLRVMAVFLFIITCSFYAQLNSIVAVFENFAFLVLLGLSIIVTIAVLIKQRILCQESTIV